MLVHMFCLRFIHPEVLSFTLSHWPPSYLPPHLSIPPTRRPAPARPLPTCPSRSMLDTSKTQSQCENLILSNISPLSDSDRGENGLKFRFARFCLTGMALGGARGAIRAGLVGWLVEQQGNPEQDNNCSGHSLAEEEHEFVKF